MPLHPRRRIAGLPFGDTRSVRRGGRFDLIGSRPYRPGDDPRLIDRHTSARLSSVSDVDLLIVREHHAEERLTVGLAVDRSPTMALHPETLPWLHKPAAVAEVERVLTASAHRTRARLLRLDSFPTETPPPGVRTGSMIFVLSDFLAFPPDEAWEEALARGWDVVPVVIQDPVWEQSFPAVGGVCLPLADGPLLLTRGEAARRRDANEARLAAIVERLENLGLEPVVLGSADPDLTYEALLDWADARRSALAWSG